MNLGPVELLISTAVLLLTCLFPIATLVLVYLTYDKVRPSRRGWTGWIHLKQEEQ